MVIPRYTVSSHGAEGEDYAHVESPDGEWMSAEDVLAELERLERINSTLYVELAKLAAVIKRAEDHAMDATLACRLSDYVQYLGES